jgi:Na+(H+)/acetate symporter ActP
VLRRPSLLVIVWLVVGLVLASQKNYLDNIDSLKRFASAILAIVFWPLLLLGIDLHIR